MAWTDVLPTIEHLAPMIATGLGGPLAGGAVAALEAVFGISPAPSASMDDRQGTVATAVTNATPEQLAAVRKADQDYAARMAEAGFKDKETLASLAFQEAQAYIEDTANARRANSANQRVFWLGCVILATFAGMVFASLWGSYALLTGQLPVADAATVGMVSGFIGTVIGYVSANAAQVVSFYFGSSKGSEAKTDAMASAFTQAFGGNPSSGQQKSPS